MIIMSEKRTMTAGELAALLDAGRDYPVLLCDDSAYPGTNWTDTFRVEIDHEMRVVRLKGECT